MAESASSLYMDLQNYYRDNVRIKEHDEKEAKAIVEKIKNDVRVYFKNTHSNIDFHPFEHKGSTYDRLKVQKPDEFDIEMPLKMDQSKWSIQKGEPGCDYIQSTGSDPGLGKFVTPDKNLSPTKLRQAFQGYVDKFLHQYKPTGGYTITRSCHGPAITLDVKYGDRKKMSIDLVPALAFKDMPGGESRHYVAKSPKGASSDNLWTRSYSLEEKAIFIGIDRDQGCRRQCLQILKSIKEDNPSRYGFLSSYHFKTVIMDMKDADWSKAKLAERFKDALLCLEKALKAKTLHHHFEKRINLLKNTPPGGMENTARYLEKTRLSGSYKCF